MQKHLPIINLSQAFTMIHDMGFEGETWVPEDGWTPEAEYEGYRYPAEHAGVGLLDPTVGEARCVKLSGNRNGLHRIQLM